jgi:hypothetical protein
MLRGKVSLQASDKSVADLARTNRAALVFVAGVGLDLITLADLQVDALKHRREVLWIV